MTLYCVCSHSPKFPHLTWRWVTPIPHCGDKDTGAWGVGWGCDLGPVRATVQPDSPDSTSCALPGLFLSGHPTHRAKPEAGLQDHRSSGGGAQG